MLILVSAGFEYQAVCRGLSCVVSTGIPKPLVLPIPIGVEPLARYLERLLGDGYFIKNSVSQVLVLGLCGSLSPQHNVGDIVLYKDCVYQSPEVWCGYDPRLTSLLHHALEEKVTLVRGLTSDRLIWSATEKRQLYQAYHADVVDMEGAALKVLGETDVAVAMLRVISDGCLHNLPNLTPAISPGGSLRPLPLAMGLLRQPLAANRLIQGSIRGLQVLQQLTTLLFSL